jgi:hypothetical protein
MCRVYRKVAPQFIAETKLWRYTILPVGVTAQNSWGGPYCNVGDAGGRYSNVDKAGVHYHKVDKAGGLRCVNFSDHRSGVNRSATGR